LSQLQASARASACPWPIPPADVRHLFGWCLFLNSLEIMADLQAISAHRIGRVRFSLFLPFEGAQMANLCVPGPSCAAI
jgi:hypothetical protein